MSEIREKHLAAAVLEKLTEVTSLDPLFLDIKTGFDRNMSGHFPFFEIYHKDWPKEEEPFKWTLASNPLEYSPATPGAIVSRMLKVFMGALERRKKKAK